MAGVLVSNDTGEGWPVRRPSRKHPDADNPQAALRLLKEAGSEGRVEIHPRVYDRIAEIGMHSPGISDAIANGVREIHESNFHPVKDPWGPPGDAFVWDSSFFGRRMYLKFRVKGKRGRIVLYSLHSADY